MLYHRYFVPNEVLEILTKNPFGIRHNGAWSTKTFVLASLLISRWYNSCGERSVNEYMNELSRLGRDVNLCTAKVAFTRKRAEFKNERGGYGSFPRSPPRLIIHPVNSIRFI